MVLTYSAYLYWLRAAIDQRKGSTVEIIAVTAPIGLYVILALMGEPDIGMLELGFALTPIVAFLFLCLPSIAGVRFVERLWRGEQPQLSDMFRLTTLTRWNICRQSAASGYGRCDQCHGDDVGLLSR